MEYSSANCTIESEKDRLAAFEGRQSICYLVGCLRQVRECARNLIKLDGLAEAED